MKIFILRIYFLINVIILLFLPAFIQISHGATLIWSANPEVDLGGYKVYYGTSPGNYESVVGVGKFTEYKLRNINEGLTYYIAVTAYDFSGNESNFSEEVDYLVNDGIPEDEDNCPQTPNGSNQGTCATTYAGIVIGTGVICTSDTDCEDGETCQMDQEDYNNNGIGDVCECYTDFDEDCSVTAPDYFLFKKEFGRYDCDQNPCQADANEDGRVTAPDYLLFKKEFGRYNCCQK